MSLNSLMPKRKAIILKKILGIVLMFTVLGISPGIFDAAQAYASPPPPMTANEAKTAESDNPFQIEINPEKQTEVVKEAVEDTEQKEAVLKAAEEKKKMSTFEDVCWLVARSLLPTVAVMAFSAAVACPLAWLVVGSILIGSATAGIITFGYEMRKNSFREEGQKQSMDKILRTVSIMAAINGALAPFQMATAGLVSTVGPMTIRSVVAAGAKSFGVQAASKVVVYGVKGAVMNAWYDHYYNYDDREKYLKHRINGLEAVKNRTVEQDQALADAKKELDTISKEKYTFKNFTKDMKKGLIWAGVSGVMGGMAAQVAGNATWAKVASEKIFATPDKAGLVANAVVSNPFAFATGAGMDAVERNEIKKEIAFTRQIQEKYPQDSPVWKFYEEKIEDLQKRHDGINLVNSGARMMLSNAIVQAATVGATAATARWQLHSDVKKKIQEKYEEADPKWSLVRDAKQRLNEVKHNYPRRESFKSSAEYKAAVKNHEVVLKQARNYYDQRRVIAAASQKQPENKARYDAIAKEIHSQVTRDRNLALAKSLGEKQYVAFKVKEMQKKAENKGVSKSVLEDRAKAEIKAEYEASARDNATALAEMTKKLEGKQVKDTKAEVILDADGKRYVCVYSKNGTEVYRKPLVVQRQTWWQRAFNKDTKKMDQKEIKEALRIVHSKAACVKPSSYRDSFINMRVNQLKARGFTDVEIDRMIIGIRQEASKATLAAFGGSTQNIVKSELLAQGLARAKYDDGEAPELSDISGFVGENLQGSVLGSWNRNLRGQMSGVDFTRQGSTNTDGSAITMEDPSNFEDMSNMSTDDQIDAATTQAVDNLLSGVNEHLSNELPSSGN